MCFIVMCVHVNGPHVAKLTALQLCQCLLVITKAGAQGVGHSLVY